MVNTATEPVFEVTLPASGLTFAQHEYRHFLRLLPELLPTYRGRYVAIHDGRVIGSDADDIALVLRVRNRLGPVPLHVGLVTEVPVVERISHYRAAARGSGERRR